MLVVADAGPIRYLIVIGHIDVLPQLFGSVAIPSAVDAELRHVNSPESVRRWLAHAPGWFSIHASTVGVGEMDDLGLGEREGITLCQSLAADAFLCDDGLARHAAEDRGLHVVGTLAVLRDAALRGLIDGVDAIERLRTQTNFRASRTLYAQFLADLEPKPPKPPSEPGA